MKIVFLWSHLSGYLNASLKSLAGRGHILLVSSFYEAGDAPFNESQFKWLRTHVHLRWLAGNIDRRSLEMAIHAMTPDLLIVSGWSHKAYKNISLEYKGKIPVVMCMDNQWLEQPKQWIGRLLAKWYIQKYFDIAFVSGERQFQFARRLGFRDGSIYLGLYTCDHERFSANRANQQDGFVFVGRLVSDKGIDTLLAAYDIYCSKSHDPWPLTIVGTGPFKSFVEASLNPGVRFLNFVQPSELPEIVGAARCLVAPSTFEPWGVQIHEATSAGLYIVCTTICGSAVHLVRDGYNGSVVAPNDVMALCDALGRAERSAVDSDISSRSRALAAQFTPVLWAKQIERIYDSYSQKKSPQYISAKVVTSSKPSNLKTL